MATSSARPTRRFGAIALAATVGALAVYAIAASWQRVGVLARQSAEREAELDEWAHSSLT